MQYDGYFSCVARNGRCIMYAQRGWVFRLPSGQRPDAVGGGGYPSLHSSLVGE